MATATKARVNSHANRMTPYNYISPVTHRRNALLSESPMNSPLLNDVINDDNTEKRDRLRSRLSEAVHQLSSPSNDRRKSTTLPLHGWNTSQITEHLHNCIQLARENKINAKNAFSLHLIDSMKELLGKDQETNFQMAGSTLEAGAKIYSSRVDALHIQALQVYDQITQLDKAQDGKADRGSNAIEDADDETPQEGVPKKKLKKKKKIIETDISKLNLSAVEQMNEIDPLLAKLSRENDSNFGGLLLGTLRCASDNGALMLDMMCRATPEPGYNPCQRTRADPDFSPANIRDMLICPTFYQFEFNRPGEHPIFDALIQRNDLRYDPNKELSICEPTDTDDGADMCDDEQGAAGSDDVLDYIGNSTSAHMGQSGLTNGTISSMLSLVSDAAGDYSFFNCNMKNLWAGPSHWKAKLTIPSGLKRPADNSSGSSKRQAGEKKSQFMLDYTEDVCFETHFKKTRAATVVSKSTLERYSKHVLTLPEDLHYNNIDLVKLCTRKDVLVKKMAVLSQVEDDGIPSADDYDYENKNDKDNFCPNMSGLSGGAEEDVDGASFAATSQQPSLADFDDTLVPQPALVEKINLQYATRPKRIDFKRLKRNMWSFITSKDMNKENEVVTASDKLMEAVPTSFSIMYQRLPELCLPHEAKDLSKSIAFVALLHLCNEKNLLLDCTEDFSDLTIRAGEE